MGKCNQFDAKLLKCCPFEVDNNNFMVTAKVLVGVETHKLDKDGERKKRKDLVI